MWPNAGQHGGSQGEPESGAVDEMSLPVSARRPPRA